MAKEISFKNLPFVPVEGQVLYIEQTHNEKFDKFIRNNYDWLRSTFRSQGLEFCFLPLLAEETIEYNAPYLNESERNIRVSEIPSLTNFLVADTIEVPSLVFALDIPVVDTAGNTVLQIVPIETQWYTSTKSTFNNLIKEIKQISCSQSRKYHDIERKHNDKETSNKKQEDTEHRFKETEEMGKVSYGQPDDNSACLRVGEKDTEPESEVRFSIPIEDDGIRFRLSEEADDSFDTQSQILIDEIRQRINALRNRGVNTMFLHDLIDEGEHLSRLKITRDFRIFLLDYDNLEIKMPVLPKSVYLLFLKHPEGIRFKELSDYFYELLEIYTKMNPQGGRNRQEQSIHDITDPCSNSINEKCARIREAFVANFDERLAKHYYVTGKRGEAKRIILDKSLILWEK